MNNIEEKIAKAKTDGIWGTKYGMDKHNDTDILHIDPNSLHFDEDGMVFIWGWPGPDYNLYKYSDYGNTWALMEREIRMQHHRSSHIHNFKVVDKIKVVKFKNKKDKDGYYYQNFDHEFVILRDRPDHDRYFLISIVNGDISNFYKDFYEFVRYANEDDIKKLNDMKIPEDWLN